MLLAFKTHVKFINSDRSVVVSFNLSIVSQICAGPAGIPVGSHAHTDDHTRSSTDTPEIRLVRFPFSA